MMEIFGRLEQKHAYPSKQRDFVHAKYTIFPKPMARLVIYAKKVKC